MFVSVGDAKSGISVGFDWLGNHKATDMMLDNYNLGNLNSDVKSGLSLRMTTIPDLTQELSFGVGVEYQIGRETEDFDGDFYFQSFWGAVYSTLDKKLYGIGHLGYGSFKADKTYKGDGITILKGGLYYGIGLGMVYDETINIEGVYCTNFGSYDTYVLWEGDFIYDVEYKRLNISIVYKI